MSQFRKNFAGQKSHKSSSTSGETERLVSLLSFAVETCLGEREKERERKRERGRGEREGERERSRSEREESEWRGREKERERGVRIDGESLPLLLETL